MLRWLQAAVRRRLIWCGRRAAAGAGGLCANSGPASASAFATSWCSRAGGGGSSGDALQHRLEIALKESLTSALVRVDGEAASQIYAIEASFRLIDVNNKQVIFQGTSIARAGFERFSSVYSNVRAREDAENRAAKVIAEDIKTRLATYLSREA